MREELVAVRAELLTLKEGDRLLAVRTPERIEGHRSARFDLVTDDRRQSPLRR
jgi:hypothetical protein